jgi:DNA-binding response OmpR family regulator
VIEDERTLLDGLLTVFDLEDFETLGAPDGAVGLQYAREYIPDLIICDVSMPELNGFELLAALQRDPKTARIPLVFLSAKTEEMTVKRGLDMGAADYILKPFSIDELLDRVRALLNR